MRVGLVCIKQPPTDQVLNFHQLPVLYFKKLISDVPSVKRGDFFKNTPLENWPMLCVGFELLKGFWAFLCNRKDRRLRDALTELPWCFAQHEHLNLVAFLFFSHHFATVFSNYMSKIQIQFNSVDQKGRHWNKILVGVIWGGRSCINFWYFCKMCRQDLYN